MKNIELLAPAGDQESLIAAIQNGANAIYLGGTLFNARAFAKNFDYQQLCWAVEYAHLHSVKIYVTVNTLYKDEEFKGLIDYIDDLYDIQVDALIIQDIGLFDMIKRRYPDFEIHISTQASVMNSYGVKYFESIGASRVVLARENTLEEIKNICHSTDLEIEVFIHGALCVCYSGQCLMSSFIGQRSGNRGECAQPCRLQYRLQKDNQLLNNSLPFLLSPKDLMTIREIGQLIDAGVTSFKIEGRMKRPEYVASVVKAYRHAIDAYCQNDSICLDDDIEAMQGMFNRNYTKGYAFSDAFFVDGDYSGNKGIIIGEVKEYNRKKKRVICQLNGKLSQGDSLVFEDIDKGRPVNKIYYMDKLVSQGAAGQIVEIEFDYPVFKGNIRKTVNSILVQELQQTYQKENIRQPIQMFFSAKIGAKAILKVVYQDITVINESQSIVEVGINRILEEERIIQQLKKVGSTIFCIQNISLDIDQNMLLSIKELNELRRTTLDDLTCRIKGKKIHVNEKKSLPKLELTRKKDNMLIYVVVSTLEQLKVAIQYPIDCIYYPFQTDIEQAYQFCIDNHKDLGLVMPRICKDSDINEIRSHSIYDKIKKVMVHDYGTFHACHDKDVIIGTGLNVYNSESCRHYQNLKILSLEMSQKQIQSLTTDFQQCFIQIYGKIENMVSEYCPISQYYFQTQKKNCGLCHNHHFSLIDRKNEKFDLMMDEKCRMHLLNCRTLYISQLAGMKVQGFFMHFTNESENTTKFVLDDVFQFVSQYQPSQIKQENEFTNGYFKR